MALLPTGATGAGPSFDGGRGGTQQGGGGGHRGSADCRGGEINGDRQDGGDSADDCESKSFRVGASRVAHPAAEPSGGLGRNPCQQKAHAFPNGLPYLSQESHPRRRRKRGRICSPQAIGAQSGRCTATNCRRATTRAARTKKFRAI